jgi:hypothetical protein
MPENFILPGFECLEGKIVKKGRIWGLLGGL